MLASFSSCVKESFRLLSFVSKEGGGLGPATHGDLRRRERRATFSAKEKSSDVGWVVVAASIVVVLRHGMRLGGEDCLGGARRGRI